MLFKINCYLSQIIIITYIYNWIAIRFQLSYSLISHNSPKFMIGMILEDQHNRCQAKPCCLNVLSYILVYKSIFWIVKREFPEAPWLICRSYFLPAEGKMFSAILDTHRIQSNKSQSQNKIVTSLPTNPLLFNK